MMEIPRKAALAAVPDLAVTVLALLAVGLLAPFPAAAAAADEGAEKTVTVALKYDTTDPKKPVPIGVAAPVPDPVEISKGKKHRVHWVLSPEDAGTLKIEMQDKDRKPFGRHPDNQGKHSISVSPDLGEVGQSYKYTIKVRVDGQKEDLVLDPIIIVRP